MLKWFFLLKEFYEIGKVKTDLLVLKWFWELWFEIDLLCLWNVCQTTSPVSAVSLVFRPIVWTNRLWVGTIISKIRNTDLKPVKYRKKLPFLAPQLKSWPSSLKTRKKVIAWCFSNASIVFGLKQSLKEFSINLNYFFLSWLHVDEDKMSVFV